MLPVKIVGELNAGWLLIGLLDKNLVVDDEAWWKWGRLLSQWKFFLLGEAKSICAS